MARLVALPVPADVAELAQKVSGHDGSSWAFNCHVASIAIVNSGLYPGSRVARGAAQGVGGQHSWVVLPGISTPPGELVDPYDPNARVLDPTLWSYDERVQRVLEGPNLLRHWPKGLGMLNIDELPYYDGSQADRDIVMPREVADKLSYKARDFLLKLGAVSYGSREVRMPPVNWMHLGNAPVQGWPAAEIIEAMYHTPGLAAFVPVDIAGMLTTLNPEGLYLPSDEYHEEN
ncbi:hypothetical protein SEA_MAGRITTE_213 [Microbacterium phage Magritte]|nr:hypothetical protein SEA_MAGRITTE_213 [Microbacterium phage Magritte]